MTGAPDNGEDGEDDGLVRLPLPDLLDSLLAESDSLDAILLAEPESEFRSGELGKTKLEATYQIPSLALLEHQQRQVARALAPLGSLFEGRPSMADAKRKQHRNLIATDINDTARAAWEKEQAILPAKERKAYKQPSETELERLANIDPRHLTFCEHLESLQTKFIRGRLVLLQLSQQVADRMQALRVVDAEIRAGIRTAPGA